MTKKRTAPSEEQKPKGKAGRPKTYTPDVVDEVCERLSLGEPLAAICRDEHMPDRSTVHRWCEASEEIAQRIARARDDGEEMIAANLRRIARGLEGSTGDVQRDKLVVDTDLKLLAKWNPKKWGDKLEVEGKLKTKHTIRFKG